MCIYTHIVMEMAAAVSGPGHKAQRNLRYRIARGTDGTKPIWAQKGTPIGIGFG